MGEAMSSRSGPMLPSTAKELSRQRAVSDGPRVAAVEQRAWGVVLWETDRGIEALSGRMWQTDPDEAAAYVRWHGSNGTAAVMAACALIVAAGMVGGLVLANHVAWHPLLMVLSGFIIGLGGAVVLRSRWRRPLPWVPVTGPAQELMSQEVAVMDTAHPDAGLLALVREAITHPAHHTAAAVDAITAAIGLVEVSRGTPMRTTTTVTLTSLADAAGDGNPHLWEAMLDMLLLQIDQIKAWRVADAKVTAAVEAPTQDSRFADAHRDLVADVFAALDEQIRTETAVLPTDSSQQATR